MGEPERGYDGSKRLPRRKRHPLSDAGGLVLGACVHTARLHVLRGERELPKRRDQGGLPFVGRRTQCAQGDGRVGTPRGKVGAPSPWTPLIPPQMIP
jgi:hypothetical protein